MNEQLKRILGMPQMTLRPVVSREWQNEGKGFLNSRAIIYQHYFFNNEQN